jgi:DMSO/TMAO reductase YedYZ molybdopterin-dependent catalytic subunit
MNPIGRRQFLSGAGASLLAAPDALQAQDGARVVLPFANGERPLVRLPGKRAMIGLTARPPQLETPFEVFGESLLTPNDAFFVRYHFSDIPTAIDPATFRLVITGHVDQALSLSLAELRRDFEAHELVAVNQCSGNGRGLFKPRIGGGQLGNGAMGNARWTGVPLRALLDKAGVRAGAAQVSFDGLDRPPAEGIADFVKALGIDHARDGEALVAFAMNGEDLPFLNGFPLRLVVPGYYGTYWIKHLSHIEVMPGEYDGYWMKTAYRIPDNDCACVEAGGRPDKTRPITRMNVRSFVTSPRSGDVVRSGQSTELRGIAFDGGSGIAAVQVSVDGGRSWQAAHLGEDLGRYSFREWRLALPLAPGRNTIMSRAVAGNGETQPLEPLWQPAGYMRNVVEKLELEVA